MHSKVEIKNIRVVDKLDLDITLSREDLGFLVQDGSILIDTGFGEIERKILIKVAEKEESPK